MPDDRIPEQAIAVVRRGLIAFIKKAEQSELAEIAACVERIENPDPAELRRELMRALQQEALKRR